MPAIHFINEHKSLDVLPGTNLRKAALKSGIHLYGALHRVLHLNVDLGPLKFPCASDVVEILDGKGASARTPEEEHALSGRWIRKRKITPNHRLACQVVVNGDVTVKTMPKLEFDMKETKARAGYLAVVGGFVLLMLVIFALIGLDLVKKI